MQRGGFTASSQIKLRLSGFVFVPLQTETVEEPIDEDVDATEEPEKEASEDEAEVEEEEEEEDKDKPKTKKVPRWTEAHPLFLIFFPGGEK